MNPLPTSIHHLGSRPQSCGKSIFVAVGKHARAKAVPLQLPTPSVAPDYAQGTEVSLNSGTADGECQPKEHVVGKSGAQVVLRRSHTTPVLVRALPVLDGHEEGAVDLVRSRQVEFHLSHEHLHKLGCLVNTSTGRSRRAR